MTATQQSLNLRNNEMLQNHPAFQGLVVDITFQRHTRWDGSRTESGYNSWGHWDRFTVWDSHKVRRPVISR